jgi:DNA-binding response OmpR family regulator
MRMSARAPASIFLVEDEPMIRMLVVEMLEELGHRVVAEAGDISAALGLGRTIECDLAILDVNVDGHIISPVAELLRKRQIPIIFATGYDSSSLPENYRGLPALQKPFQLEALDRLVSAVLQQAQT